MSTTTTRHDATTAHTARRLSSETKASYKTTELIAYVAAVVAVLVATAMVDNNDFGPREGWFFVTLLTIGYMISRGLAKAGSRDFYDADADASHR